jgi:membrane dipeptidase
LPKLREGGVDAVFLSVGSETVTVDLDPLGYWATTPPRKFCFQPVFRGPALVKRILWSIDALQRMVEKNNDVIELALCAADVERIVAKGKIAAILHITRGAIDDDLAVLRTYHRLGVRAMQIAYDDGEPAWVDSCHARPVANGLSDFGRDVIHEMNRLGILIDLAHASDKAYADVIATSHKPVISSHSGARALCNVWRNLSDDTMRQLAARGSTTVSAPILGGLTMKGWSGWMSQVSCPI